MSDVLEPHGDNLLDRPAARSGRRRRRSYPVLPAPPPQRVNRRRYKSIVGAPPRLGWPRGLAGWQEFLRYRLLPAGIMFGGPAIGATALLVAVTVGVLHFTMPRHRAAPPILAEASVMTPGAAVATGVPASGAAGGAAVAPAIPVASDVPADQVGVPQNASYEAMLAELFELDPARLDDPATIRGYASRYDCTNLHNAANEFRRAALFDLAHSRMRDTTRALDPAKATYRIREFVIFGDYDFAAQKFPILLPSVLRMPVMPLTAHNAALPAGDPASQYCAAREGLPAAFTITMADVSGLTGLAMPPDKAERFLAARTVRAHDGLHTEANRTLTAEITFRVVGMSTRRGDQDGAAAAPHDGTDDAIAAPPVTAASEMIGFTLFDEHGTALYTADPAGLAERVAAARLADAARPILARFALRSGTPRDGATRLDGDQLPLLYAALSHGAPPLDDYLQALPSVQALPLFSTERRLLVERLRAPLQSLVTPITERPDRLWRVELPVRLPRPSGPDVAVPLRGLATDAPDISRDLGAGHYTIAFDPPDGASLPAGISEDAVAANGGMRVMAAQLLLRPVRAELTADGQRVVVMHPVAVELRGRADGRLILRHAFEPAARSTLSSR